MSSVDLIFYHSYYKQTMQAVWNYMYLIIYTGTTVDWLTEDKLKIINRSLNFNLDITLYVHLDKTVLPFIKPDTKTKLKIGPVTILKKTFDILFTVVYRIEKEWNSGSDKIKIIKRTHLLNEPHHKKTCFCHMRTTKAQINLCIRTVRSAPLLFAA